MKGGDELDRAQVRAAGLSKLEQFVRFPLIDAVSLIDKVEPLNLVDQELLVEAYKYLALPSSVRDKYIDNIRTRTRGAAVRAQFKREGLPAGALLSDDALTVRNLVEY